MERERKSKEKIGYKTSLHRNINLILLYIVSTTFGGVKWVLFVYAVYSTKVHPKFRSKHERQI